VALETKAAEYITTALTLAFAHVEVRPGKSLDEIVELFKDGLTLGRGQTTREITTDETDSVALGNVRVFDSLAAVTGRLGQVLRPEAGQRVFDAYSKEFRLLDEEAIRPAVAVPFVLDLQTGWMVVEDGAALSARNAVRIFQQLVNAAADIEVVRSRLAERDGSIGQFLLEVEIVTAVRATIRPTNPGRDRYRLLDQELARAKAEVAALEARNPKGLVLSDPNTLDQRKPVPTDTVFDQALLMAVDGYDAGEGYSVRGQTAGLAVEYDGQRDVMTVHDEIPMEDLAGLMFEEERFVQLLVERLRDRLTRVLRWAEAPGGG
jgi:hypothetical protein